MVEYLNCGSVKRAIPGFVCSFGLRKFMPWRLPTIPLGNTYGPTGLRSLPIRFRA